MDTNYYKQFEPFFGSWNIKTLLGEGSYGKVYEIEREDFGKTYTAALKAITIPPNKSEVDSIRSSGMDDASVTSYFEGMVKELVKEFELMSKLKGESHIVSYEDHLVVPHKDDIGWDIFIRMELLTPMNKFMQKTKFTNKMAIKMAIDICDALELCKKQNIIHRDLKPENLFVSENGSYKLGDFGVARSLENANTMSKKGTYKYMAPEVNKGQNYDSTIDIYSLGLVLYELFNFNREAFLPLPPAQFTFEQKEEAFIKRMKGESLPTPAKADSVLASIILKACAYEAKDRYQSPYDMKKDLEKYIQTGNIEEYGLFDNTGIVNKPPVDKPPVTPPLHPKDQVQCPECGTMSDEGQKFCKNCGKRLIENSPFEETTKKCPFCGGTLKVDQKFCVHCGKNLNEKQEPPIQPDNTKKCAKCGGILKKEQKFCVHCGTTLLSTENKNSADIFNEILTSYVEMWKNYANFKGRMTRKTFWLAYAMNFVITLVLGLFGYFTGFMALYSLYALAAMVPGLSMGARRLHDTNRSAHWLWLILTGYGAIAIIVFYCYDSVNENNRFND